MENVSSSRSHFYSPSLCKRTYPPSSFPADPGSNLYSQTLKTNLRHHLQRCSTMITTVFVALSQVFSWAPLSWETIPERHMRELSDTPCNFLRNPSESPGETRPDVTFERCALSSGCADLNSEQRRPEPDSCLNNACTWTLLASVSVGYHRAIYEALQSEIQKIVEVEGPFTVCAPYSRLRDRSTLFACAINF